MSGVLAHIAYARSPILNPPGPSSPVYATLCPRSAAAFVSGVEVPAIRAIGLIVHVSRRCINRDSATALCNRDTQDFVTSRAGMHRMSQRRVRIPSPPSHVYDPHRPCPYQQPHQQRNTDRRERSGYNHQRQGPSRCRRQDHAQAGPQTGTECRPSDLRCESSGWTAERESFDQSGLFNSVVRDGSGSLHQEPP